MKSEVKQLRSRAKYLLAKFKQEGETRYIDEVITLDRQVLKLCPPGHPMRPASLTELAIHLSHRYGQLGAAKDLEEAIVLDREALKLRPQGHPQHLMSLNNLAFHLSTRYDQGGGIQDLDEVIVLDQEAIDLFPQGHPDRSGSLNNLAVHLSIRYNHLGEMQDLNKAITFSRETVNLCPQGHHQRSSFLNNLAAHLSTRYTQLGAIQDLNEAIVLSRESLNLFRLPQGHRHRSIALNNLATDLFTRHNKLGAVQDLDEAIVLDEEALNFLPRGYRYRPTADLLYARYNKFGAIQDLDEAILLHREALNLHPQGHPGRFGCLNNLAVDLFTRYDQLGQMQDLDEAIALLRDVLALCPPGHPNRSASLNNLGCYLRSRFTRSKKLQDKEELFSYFAQLVHVTHTVSSFDLSAARSWICAAEDFQHPTLLLAYETSLRLLVQHFAALPSLPQHLVILKRLTSSLAVDAFSACLRGHAPALAVELLEQGRGVFWGQLTRLYSPLEDVMGSGSAGKTLADEFTRLALLIRGALNSPGPDQHERLWHLNLEMQKTVLVIHELPGLSRFLLPSLFSDLQDAASGGPVIIVNASQNSCDALVVLADRDPVHIPLQIARESVRDLSTELRIITERATRADMTRELAFFLRKLWDQIVSPIVDFLKTTLGPQSRIWWCATGEFSHLPLHAAGPYRKGQRNPISISRLTLQP